MTGAGLTEGLEHVRSVAFDNLGWGFVSTVEFPADPPLPQEFEVHACHRSHIPGSPCYTLTTADGARAARAHAVFLRRMTRWARR